MHIFMKTTCNLRFYCKTAKLSTPKSQERGREETKEKAIGKKETNSLWKALTMRLWLLI